MTPASAHERSQIRACVPVVEGWNGVILVARVCAAVIGLLLTGPVWHAPRWWLPGAVCIHHYEGAWHSLTGNGFAGGFQFTLGTWNEAGTDYGSLWAVSRAPVREQVHRAWIIWKKRGGRWGRDWPNTARVCGLR